MTQIPPTKIVKALQAVQKRATAAQKAIEAATFEGSAGGGLVSLKLSGKGALLSLSISPEAISEGHELLEDLVMAAFRSAESQKEDFSSKQLGTIATGGLSIPGLSLPGLAG